MSDRDGRGARQGGEVDEMGRAVAQRVGQRVGEDEPSFGVGVDDLDRLAVRADHHVAGTLGCGAGHVLGGCDYSHDVERQLAGRDHVDRRQHRGSP